MTTKSTVTSIGRVVTVGAGGLLGLGLLYIGVLRPRHLVWGATDDEVARSLPGDEVVPHPTYLTTRAVTVDAPAAKVWPWLMQIGYQRGGLYSYNWLDRLFGILDRPSAEQILPEFQHLAPGDVIPLGTGPDWPVHAVSPERALVLAPNAPGMTITWAFILDERADGTTHLISRVRGGWPPRQTTNLAMRALMEPLAFLMERRMLLGIKKRAERLADAPGNPESAPPPPTTAGAVA